MNKKGDGTLHSIVLEENESFLRRGMLTNKTEDTVNRVLKECLQREGIDNPRDIKLSEELRLVDNFVIVYFSFKMKLKTNMRYKYTK